MYTVKETAEFLGIAVPTLHTWVKDDRISYAEFLSPSALDTSEAGRTFTEDDVILLWTVQALREMNQTHRQIKKQIKDGFRIQPDSMPGEVTSFPMDLQARETAMKKQIQNLVAEREALQSEMDYYKRASKEQERKNEKLLFRIFELEAKIKELDEDTD
jgi:DNA-binding transcriptional MerR regulator